MKRALLGCFWVLMLWQLPLFAQDQLSVKNLNLNDHYRQRTPFDLDFEIATDGKNAFSVFMQMELRQQRDLLTNYVIEYALLANYEERINPVFIRLDFERTKIAGGNNIHYLRELVSADTSKNLLLFRIHHKDVDQKFYRLIPLRDGVRRLYSDFLVFDPTLGAPVFGNAMQVDTMIELRRIYGEAKEAYVFRYEETFLPAEPPMIVQSNRVSPELEIKEERILAFETPIRLSSEGFYFFQSDTTAAFGKSIVVTDRFFPRPVLINDVMEPLVYLSSADEFTTLSEAENPKIALDNQLVKMAREQKTGRDIMRDYFRNVTSANRFFTTYKYGWKTDMGMIYAVYGEPDEVKMDANKQEWVYLNRGRVPRLTFFFTRVPNVFTHEHYVLARDRRYAEFYFSTVDSWRRGRRGL
jgi:GWxTD domain-containing protein